VVHEPSVLLHAWLPSRGGSLSKIIPQISRAQAGEPLTTRTLQGMARVRSGWQTCSGLALGIWPECLQRSPGSRW